MSRVDKPTIQCDRCKATTSDLREMGDYRRISHSHMSGEHDWDLCPECWKDFIQGYMVGVNYPMPPSSKDVIMFDGMTLEEYMNLRPVIRNLLIGIPVDEEVTDEGYEKIFKELAGRKIV